MGNKARSNQPSIVKRENEHIELTRDEIIFLWEKRWGDPFPENLDLMEAAKTVLLEYGAERMASLLDKR